MGPSDVARSSDEQEESDTVRQRSGDGVSDAGERELAGYLPSSELSLRLGRRG